MHKVILDTDIGTDVDDALALAVLLGSKDVELIGISTVYGDVRLRSAIAMHLCSLVNRPIPTFIGESNPISGREVWMSGSEGKNFKDLDSYNPQDTSAVNFLVEAVNSQPQSIDVIAVGPLTNIARALESSPDFVKNVKRIWIMETSPRLRLNITLNVTQLQQRLFLNHRFQFLSLICLALKKQLSDCLK